MSKGFFIDVQGTLIDDINKEPIEGSCEFIDYLNQKSIPYVVITNNTKQNSKSFLNELKLKGFDIKNYIDPFYILEDSLKDKKIAAFGTKTFIEVLKSLGYELDYENPETLVVSIKKDYCNEDYAQMIECAYKAKNLIGMHGTSTYSKEGKRYPGVGSIMNMIKFAVNKDFKIVGKPSSNFYNEARSLINCDFKDITIISDDMIGDLIGAQKLDMKSTLVLSGKTKTKEEIISTLQENEMPNNIYKDMSEVLSSLKKGEV